MLQDTLHKHWHGLLACQPCTLPSGNLNMLMTCLQLCLQATPHAHAATHHAQRITALLASQPCTLHARSGDLYTWMTCLQVVCRQHHMHNMHIMQHTLHKL